MSTKQEQNPWFEQLLQNVPQPALWQNLWHDGYNVQVQQSRAFCDQTIGLGRQAGELLGQQLQKSVEIAQSGMKFGSEMANEWAQLAFAMLDLYRPAQTHEQA